MATVFRQDLPLFWSYSVAISLNAASLVLMGWGLLRIDQQDSNRQKLTGLGLASLIFTGILEYSRMLGSPSLMLILPGLVFGGLSLWTAHHAHVYGQSRRIRFAWHMRWVMAGGGLVATFANSSGLDGLGHPVTWPRGLDLGDLDRDIHAGHVALVPVHRHSGPRQPS